MRAVGWKRGRRGFALVVLSAAHAFGVACEPYPRDPERTLERAAGGTLRVGVSEAPPWLVREGDQAGGPEAELIQAFAASVDARIDWRWGAAHEHLLALEHFELDLVAAGLTRHSPWKTRVSLTRPWRIDGDTSRVLATPPGENRLLVALERLIESRRRDAAP